MNKHEFIFLALGTSGDVNPLLGLAIELSKRGYDLTFLTNDHFKNSVQKAGLNFYSIGTDDQYQQGNSSACWDDKTSVMTTLDAYLTPALEPAYDFVTRKYAENCNLTVISSSLVDGARTAADKLKIPAILVTFSPNQFFSAYSPSAPLCWSLPKWLPNYIKPLIFKIKKSLLEIRFSNNSSVKNFSVVRKKLGALKIDKSYKQQLLHICFFPDWFGMPAKDWPKDLNLVGFPLYDPTINATYENVDRFIEEKGTPILFTPGTGVPNVGDYFTVGMQVCEELKVPGIFVGGKLGKDVLANSTFCLHVDYVDFEYVLPKCHIIVHHGGIGTLAKAIQAGIPQLIRPLKYDQPDNARRLHMLNLGGVVWPDRFSAQNLMPIIRMMIKTKNENKSLQMYSQKVRRSRAIHEACNLIEKTLFSK